jgi:Mce-associated membrane protein
MSRSDRATRTQFGWPLLTMLAVFLVLVAAGVALGVKWHAMSAEQKRYDSVLDAATAEALAFTTLDHRTVEEDIAQVLEGATGSFKKQFQSSSSQLKQLTAQNKSVSKGQVLKAGVVSSDEDSARVIVVADSTVSNVRTPSPQPRHYRLQLDLVRKDDQWLTSDLQFVG